MAGLVAGADQRHVVRAAAAMGRVGAPGPRFGRSAGGEDGDQRGDRGRNSAPRPRAALGPVEYWHSTGFDRRLPDRETPTVHMDVRLSL
jgi:hypothetical protein